MVRALFCAIVMSACGAGAHRLPPYTPILVDEQGHRCYVHTVYAHAMVGGSDVEEILSVCEPAPWMDPDPLELAIEWVDAHTPAPFAINPQVLVR